MIHTKQFDILEKASVGFALHKMLLNEEGTPCDFIFLEVNQAFKTMMGLEDKDIVQKKASDVFPELSREHFDWMGFFTQIALEEKVESTEQFFNFSQCYYRVEAHAPEKYYFCTLVSDITQKKKELKQEEELRETKLKELQQMAKIGNWELNVLNGDLFWSEEVYHVFGIEPHSVPPSYQVFLSWIHPDDRKMVDLAYSDSIKNKQDFYQIDHRIIRQDTQQIRYVFEKCIHIKDENNQIIRSIGMVQDITDRKETEENLKELNDELRTEIENRAEAEHKLIEKQSHLERSYEEMDTANAELVALEEELRQQLEALDHTNRALAYSQLQHKKQTEFLNLVINSLAHPFYVIDAVTFNIVMANEAFFMHHDLPMNFKFDKNKCYELSHHFNHPCSNKDHPCPLEEIKRTGKPAIMQHIHKTADGQERIVEVNAFPVFEASEGKLKQIIEYTVDITDRIKEQEKLRENEEWLRSIITTSPDGIVVTDLNGNITFASDRAAQLIGYSHANDLMNQNIADFIHDDDLPSVQKAVYKLLDHKTDRNSGIFKAKTKDGKVFYQESNGALLYNSEGNAYSMVFITRDVTHRISVQKELLDLNEQLTEKKFALEELNKSLEIKIQDEVEKNRQKDQVMSLQSRQAAMGEMIGNIAHQWRQPLNTINLVVFDLMDAHKHGELNEDYLENSYNEINKTVQHMSQTIDDFRNFFKPTKQKKIFEINTLIRQSISFVQSSFTSYDIELDYNPTPTTINIMGYPNELMQCFINIMNNAKDAFLENKTNQRKLHIYLKEIDNCKIKIDICNNGGQINEENLERIFEPYFSTKPEGEGTGLGLFIAKTIVENNMKGKLTVKNTDDGVCFSFVLVCQEQEEF